MRNRTYLEDKRLEITQRTEDTEEKIKTIKWHEVENISRKITSNSLKSGELS